ncbi:unnamed protein product, partial [Staurois parvus]
GATGLGPSGGAAAAAGPPGGATGLGPIVRSGGRPDPQEERQVLGPSGGKMFGAGTRALRPPDWSDQVSGPQAERRAPRPPGGCDRSRALKAVSGGRLDPQAEQQVSGPQAERRATESHQARQWVSESDWYDRRHWFRHCMVWLDSGHRGHQASGHLLDSGHVCHLARQWAPSVNWYDRGALGSDIGSSDRTAGIGSPGIRSFGSTAGTASSGKAVGSESTWY